MRATTLQHSVTHKTKDKRDDRGRVSDPRPSKIFC